MSEKIGAKVRSTVQRKPDLVEFSVIGGIANENITRVLGRDSVGRLVGDLAPIMRPELDAFSRTVTKIAARAGHPTPSRLAQHAVLAMRDQLDQHLYGNGSDATPEVYAPLIAASLV